MALTDGQRRTLSRKAADNSLEVEHLLRVAAIGNAVDAPFLRASAEHGWSDTGYEDPNLAVPFSRWVDTVCRFLEDGHAGIVRLAGESPRDAEFCIGLLEEMPTAESVSSLLAIGKRLVEPPDANPELAVRLANAFNILLSFKGAPTVALAIEGEIREFLHRLLATNLNEAQRASAVCALRGVGDADSVDSSAAYLFSGTVGPGWSRARSRRSSSG